MTVDQQLADIRAHMPEVYANIQAKAREIGNTAYALVRRGLRGEPNCFYAFEAGRVVGTPFAMPGVSALVAQAMVMFGGTLLVVWPESATASTDGSTGAPTLPPPPVGTPGAESRAGNSTPARALVAGSGKSPVNSPRAGG